MSLQDGLVKKLLSKQQQDELMHDLIENGNIQGVLNLVELTGFDFAQNKALSRLLSGKIIQLLKVEFTEQDDDIDVVVETKLDTKNLRLHAQLIGKARPLWKELQNEIIQMIANCVRSNNKNYFDSEYFRQLEAVINLKSFESDTKYNLQSILIFLETVYLFFDDEKVASIPEISYITIALLNSKNESTAVLAGKLMRWEVHSIQKLCKNDLKFDFFTWQTIKTMCGIEIDDFKQRNVLIFLLRYLSTKDISSELLKFLQTDSYWHNIQHAMNGQIHEYRKLGLSVLKLSIQLISENKIELALECMKWNFEQNDLILDAWKKYTTLYEIIALDTALNQFQAAANDVIDICGEKLIGASWALILFATGLQASMEGVRKFTMSLMLKVPNKGVFASNLITLRSNTLPMIMLAHYYSTDGETCFHGERTVSFVKEMMNETDDRSFKEVVETVLKTLIDHGTSFDASRIYVSLGLLKFFKSKKSKRLSNQHMPLIQKLFEFESEEEIAERTFQAILLKLLLHVDNTVTPSILINTIATQITCKKSYEYFSPILEDFRDFAITNYDRNFAIQDANYDGENGIHSLLSALIFDISVSPTYEFLVELSKSDEVITRYDNNMNELLLKMIHSDVEVDRYQLLYHVVGYQGFTEDTWKLIEFEPLYQEIITTFHVGKFKFIISLAKKLNENNLLSLNSSIDSLFTLYSNILDHCKTLDPKAFKVKDEIFGLYFNLFSILFKFYEKSFTDNGKNMMTLLNMMHDNVLSDNGNYQGNLAVAHLCEVILETKGRGHSKPLSNEPKEIEYTYNCFKILTFIWQSLADERLVLKQRELHLLLINCIFNPQVILGAVIGNAPNREIIKSFGLEIVAQSQFRRGFLPVLSKCIYDIMEVCSETLKENKDEIQWIIKLICEIYSQQPVSYNVYKLKPTLALLYDHELAGYNKGNAGLYELIYGSQESAAKVSIIDVVINRSMAIQNMLFDTLSQNKVLLKPVKRIDGIEEQRRVFLWQLVLLIMTSVSKERLKDFIEKQVLESLIDESSPLVRIYKEWAIAYQLYSDIKLIDDELKASVTEEFLFSQMMDHSKPIAVVSKLRALYVGLKALASSKSSGCQRLLKRFISVLIPNASSNKPLVRHFSNSLMLSFWPTFENSITDPTLRLVLQTLYQNAKRTEITGQFRSGDANVWELNKDYTLVNICGVILKKLTDHNSYYIPQELFTKQFTHDSSIPIGVNDEEKWLKLRSSLLEAEQDSVAVQTNSQLQTKSGAWEAVLDIDAKKSEQSVSRSDLIVVSSLVDKAPNLGGICRLCDVLGVGLLTVQDIKVKNHPQFKNVAVTADKWMPMQQVAVDEIVEFMLSKKKEGYTLIGLEQTDKSIQLNENYKFPKKSLILLGTEAHGIPGNLLSELDLCLEIQQHGVIRSMNIQTATAVITYAYTVQHL